MKPAKRKDLVVCRTVTRLVHPYIADQSTHRYELGVVTSITRESKIKSVRLITGRAAAAGITAPTRVERLPRGGMLVLPAAQFRVSEAIADVLARRATPEGDLPAYDSPVELLRDLHPWTSGDDACLSDLRSVAYTFLRETADQRCDDCGVTTYGNSRIDVSGIIPTVHCQPSCPVGVNYTTNYPVGLEVEVTDGFAAGATTRIERVSDAYFADVPPDEAGTRYYSGRSYTVDLPGWGYRPMGEDIFRPVDPQLAERYTVRREVPTSS